MTDLHYATLLEASDAIRSREVSPVELTRALLDRIDKLEPQLRCYATVTRELALAQAKQAEKDIMAGESRGPLHGVPVAVKDLCDTAGITTAAGMKINAGRAPALDATVVTRLAAAGAVLLGKLQLTEGAFAEHHPGISAPRNPWHSGYWSGASSSGPGVAAAAGLCFGALGSDTGGSIRYPSAANGVTGLKPTWGRVSRHGVFPLGESLDHIGPLARTAADAGALLGVIAGLDRNDPTTLTAPVPNYLGNLGQGIHGLVIGVDTAYNEAGVDAETVVVLRDARAVLEGLGATIREVKLPDPAPVVAAWPRYCGVEAAIAHEQTYPARADDYGPSDLPGSIAGLIELGRATSAAELMKAHHARLAFTGALATVFTELDLLLIPVQPVPSLTIGEKERLYADPEELTRFQRFASPFDMSGSPTITLPGGFTAEGIPLAFQLVGGQLAEELLVRAGHAFQQATGWHERHPAL